MIVPIKILIWVTPDEKILGRSFLKIYLRNELADNISKSFESKYDVRKKNFKII